MTARQLNGWSGAVMACPPVLRALHELNHGGGWLIRSWVQLA